jgi:hypothetical protein
MPAKPKTALASAFEAAGYRSAQDRLDEIADAALADHPRTLDLARDTVLNAVAGDVELVWVMTQRWHNMAADLLLAAAAARSRAKSGARQLMDTIDQTPLSSGATASENTRDGSPQREAGLRVGLPSIAAREEARGFAARVISKLDTFRINNRPLGDCTPEEALGWRASRLRDARFILLAVSNLPPGRPIRDSITASEIEEYYARAQVELANE